MTVNRIIANNGSSIVLYTTDDGNTQLEVKLEKDTVWLTQSQMAELFGRDRTVVGRHIRNIFKEGELDETLVCAKNALPKKYGRREDYSQLAETTFYNLDVIISVGYRVKSIKGTKFRIWASALIKQYLIKGYAIDQRRRSILQPRPCISKEERDRKSRRRPEQSRRARTVQSIRNNKEIRPEIIAEKATHHHKRERRRGATPFSFPLNRIVTRTDSLPYNSSLREL